MTIPHIHSGTPCAHYAGKVSIDTRIHVAAFDVPGTAMPLSMAEILEHGRSFLARLDGRSYLISLNNANMVQVLGTAEHCEVILKATVSKASEVDKAFSPLAPEDFRMAVKLFFALDLTEDVIRSEHYALAHVTQNAQAIQTA